METRLQPRSLSGKEEVTSIGKCVIVRGELSGDEDLIIEGRVEGKIILKDHRLVIGQHGVIRGEIKAKNVTVNGKVIGNIFASELLTITATGSVEGDIESSRISVSEGAYFKGCVDLRQGDVQVKETRSNEWEPATMDLPEAMLSEVQAVTV